MTLQGFSTTSSEYKVVLIGSAHVGKTSIITSYQSKELAQNPTIAASYVQFPITVQNQNIILNVWDTAGHEKFQSLVPLYARTADALLIVYDLSDPETFTGAQGWYKQVIDEVGEVGVVVLCANKIDMVNNETNTQAAEEWANENKMLFIKTSAKTGYNLNELFHLIAEALVGDHTVTAQATTELIPKEKEKKKCC